MLFCHISLRTLANVYVDLLSRTFSNYVEVFQFSGIIEKIIEIASRSLKNLQAAVRLHLR